MLDIKMDIKTMRENSYTLAKFILTKNWNKNGKYFKCR